MTDNTMAGAVLTARERALVRNEFMPRFSSAPSLHGGFVVKRWVTGPNKGQPKPGPTIQGMIDRGLLTLKDDSSHWLRATFTEAGLAALLRMAEDRRALPPDDYRQLLDELAGRTVKD